MDRDLAERNECQVRKLARETPKRHALETMGVTSRPCEAKCVSTTVSLTSLAREYSSNELQCVIP